MKPLMVSVFGALILAMAQNGLAASNKVQVCHLPPGAPGNFHTISISENALEAHLAHGDLSGPCSGLAEVLCDDGNKCTVDAMDPETETCYAEHPPVDCGDGLLCTLDSCDPAVGCQYAPINCDDGDPCTVDACNPFDGQCASTPKDCGPLGICLSDGQCDYPCEGITCEPIDQCHEPGACVLPGTCLEGLPVADGTPCDDGDAGTTNDHCVSGACQGEVAAACPCWDEVNFQNTFPPTTDPDHNWQNGCTAGYQGTIVLENDDKPFEGAPRFGVFQATVTTRAFPGVINGCVFSNFAYYWFGLYPELGEYRSSSYLTDEQVEACVDSIIRQARAHAVPGVAWDCWPE